MEGQNGSDFSWLQAGEIRRFCSCNWRVDLAKSKSWRDPLDLKGFARTLTWLLLWISSQSTVSELIRLRIMDIDVPRTFTIFIVENQQKGMRPSLPRQAELQEQLLPRFPRMPISGEILTANRGGKSFSLPTQGHAALQDLLRHASFTLTFINFG